MCVLSCVQLFATPWIVACQVPLSLELFQQEYWSGLPFPPLGNLLNPGIEPVSLKSPALAGVFFTTSATWEAHNFYGGASQSQEDKSSLLEFSPLLY